MYGALWRMLPGPDLLRAIIALVLLAAVFLVLMEVVFPWLEELLPWTDVAVAR